MASDKFFELMKQLKEKIENAPEPEPVPAPALKGKTSIKIPGGLVAIVDPAELAGANAQSKLSMAEAAVKSKNDPAFLKKIVSGNQASMSLMSSAPIDKWLVQAYPDGADVIHFQAKATAGDVYYTRHYAIVEKEVYDAFNAAYSAGEQFRNSFYPDSAKSYLVCSRTGEVEVTIPGYGPIDVPELFGVMPKTEEVKEAAEENETEDDVEENETEDDDE